MRLIIVLGLLLSSCSPSSLEEYHFEGESLARELVRDCQRIESTEDLMVQKARLKKKFSSLVDLMIAAKKFQVGHPESELALDLSYRVSDCLEAELIRIYKIEECRPYMEEIQRESLHKLDLYLKAKN